MRFLKVLIVLTVGCHVAMADDVVKKGERLLGIGINEGSIGFDKAFPVAQSSGMQFVELSQQWDEIEPKAGKYTNQWLDIANAYYPQVGVRLVISLNPIDTNSLRLPDDDISTAKVNTYKKYYGVNARSFGEYLGTLGLRTHNGTDKRAFKILQREATARGW